MGKRADVHETIRKALVSDLASGRLYRFDRVSIEAAVECLLDRATEREIQHETVTFKAARGL